MNNANNEIHNSLLLKTEIPYYLGEEDDVDDDVNTDDDANTGDKASSIVGVFPLDVRTDKAKTHLEMLVS